ncbi:MAG: hypothetical protein HUU12_13090 [Anaerolineales bacterium]|nr:hypothetical protein [Anaerolineales bacterium]
MIQNPKRERRDWTLLIFIIPIGILLILIVGQFAVRLASFWSVNGDMNSNLEPDPEEARPFALLEPILPQILTPMAWMEYYLTPGAEVYFPPFLTFSPTASPAPTESTPTGTEPSPTQVPPTDTPSPTPSADPGTATPTNTQGGDETEPPDDGGTPTDTPTGVVSTIDPSLTQITPAPTQINVGAPPDNTDRFDLSNTYEINSGNYVVLGLNVTVEATPDGNYDLAIYEFLNFNVIYLDWFVVGISNDADGATYYEVFNWGNGAPDNNSNVADLAAGGETDNEAVNPSQLYDADGAGPAPQTGILIDVDDNNSGNPPPGVYGYVVIINPVGGGDAVQVDAVQTVEVPIPAPPAPVINQADAGPTPEDSVQPEEPTPEETAQTEEASTTEEPPPTP